VDIRDWSGTLQVVVKDEEMQELVAGTWDVGDIIHVYGNLYVTQRTHQISLLAKSVALVAEACKPPPDKRHGVTDTGFRYRHREVDLIGNEETRELFVKRAKIIRAIREWLQLKQFIEVETPVLQQMAGGAPVRPFETRHNALSRDLFLRISVELFVNRCVVGGMERVYDMGKVFRNEGISPRHSPEFTVIEWFMSYFDYKDIATETERMIKWVCQRALGRTKVNIPSKGTTVDFAEPWNRVGYRDLILTATGTDILDGEWMLTQAAQGTTWQDVASQLYQERVEPHIVGPTFVFDFPLEGFPITKRHSVNPLLGEHFDGVIGGIEIASGDTELNDPGEQRERFREQRVAREDLSGSYLTGGGRGEVVPYPNDEAYCQALEYGMAPTAGVGMGVDRLIMILLEKDTLREVIPFPIVKEER
jgi:lysyl-tRNA synthetase class 2